MPPYACVVGMYEKFSVLSSAAIRREVQLLLGTSSNNLAPSSSSSPSLLLLLRDVCDLLVKSGEWQRALVVAEAVPPGQGQSIMSLLKLTHAHTRLSSESHELQPSVASDSTPTAMELSEMSNEALVRLGFALQRSKLQPRSQRFDGSSCDTVMNSHVRQARQTLGDVLEMQRRLFIEFRRRNRCRELIQCVMNWKSKGLVPAKRGATSGDRVDGGTHAVVPVEAPFNAEEALQSLIFNASSGSQWQDALCESPDFFLTTLKEPTAALQFLRKTNADTLTRLVLSLLISGDDTAVLTTPPRLLPLPMAVVGQSGQESLVPWGTISSLCFALRPHLEQATKTVKTDLLHALLRALRRELQATATAMTGEAESARRGRAAAAAAAAASNDVRHQAMRSAVEGLCVPLLHHHHHHHHHHEAQARFVGLPLFVEIAITLRECGVSIPNALVQCVFLCLGDPQRQQWRDTPSSSYTPPALLPSSSSSSSSSSVLSRVHASPEVELLITMLSASPVDRWAPALLLLRLCDEQRSFVVTAAHLRSILSGLQSISISRMWPVALHVAQSIMEQHLVVPDESSVAKLMLSLHAASWQRAFEVLGLYEKKHVSPSPLILRDLHVVAVRHSSWDVVLRLMQQIDQTGPQYAGFMNYVYCLRAYGCAGKWSDASELFKSLKDVPGVVGHSPYNEVTVGVPVLAMMEHQHWDCVVRFVVAVRRCCGMELTRHGWHVALAAELLALTHIGDAARVASFLNSYSVLDDDTAAPPPPPPAADVDANAGPIMKEVKELRVVIAKAAQLQTLLGLEHLNAPIRLVFDQLAHDTNCHHHGAQLGPPAGSGASRPPLYLPPQHIRVQHEWLAATLGKMVRCNESLFSAAAQQALAEAMSTVGAAATYLKAALL